MKFDLEDSFFSEAGKGAVISGPHITRRPKKAVFEIDLPPRIAAKIGLGSKVIYTIESSGHIVEFGLSEANDPKGEVKFKETFKWFSTEMRDVVLEIAHMRATIPALALVKTRLEGFAAKNGYQEIDYERRRAGARKRSRPSNRPRRKSKATL
jgi:hypothetical protein